MLGIATLQETATRLPNVAITVFMLSLHNLHLSQVNGKPQVTA
ncbi:hypothetical protein [Calothrix sp. NIES-3974]|nr:hypothetical protein [Calothrix sp. NIES-3974]